MKFPRPISLSELATELGGKAVGDPGYAVLGLNEIHMVEEGDLTFVDHPKYYDKALRSAASVVLINKEVPPPDGKHLIIHEKPFDAFVDLIDKYRPFQKSSATISPTASIGEGTVIQPGAFIGNEVVIGKNCIIHAHVSIYDHSVIGDEVIIHANTVIGADAFYFQKRPEGYKKFSSAGRVVINDRVEIGALCSIDKGVSGDTIIDSGTKTDNHCQIGHDTYIGKNCLIGAHAAIAGVTRIEDDVVLWGRVSVNKDIVIKKGAVILATSALDKTVEGNGKVYFGSPAVEVRTKWRELAALKKLPEIIKTLEQQLQIKL